MGKKSRAKKEKHGWVKSKPDEVIRMGPLSIARYGKYVRLSNNSTDEQHSAFLKRSAAKNKEIVVELGREVALLQDLIQQYDALELMHRAAYVLLPLMKPRSEREYSAEESFSLPMVEYLQYLIARTAPHPDGPCPTEEEWERLWAQERKVFHLTQNYLFTRRTLANPPSEIDELRSSLDAKRLIVRVKRYPIFRISYLRDSLIPYAPWIKEIYGVEVETIIEGLERIDQYQKTGVRDRYFETMDLQKDLAARLQEKGYSVDPEASQDEIERTQAALLTNEFKAMHDKLQEKMQLTLTPMIFEITTLSSLPHSFLSLLSIKPGESILTVLTGPNHDDLSPMSTSVLHYKPFVEIDGKSYFFYHTGFEDHLAEIVEADLFQKRPAQVSEMAKRRSNQIESESASLISSVVEPDYIFKNIYYPNPDEPGHLTELDILLGVGDLLFLVEVKAGGFSAAASRGAPKSMDQELSDLIMEGQRQSERAEKYVKSSNEAIFFDETGKQEICRVKCSDLRRIFRVVVTREDLGWVGAQIAILAMLDPNLSKSYPWHVSIDDLRVIAALFKSDGIRFVHYLEQRLVASAQTTLTQKDEIEHVALYHKINQYHDLPVRGVDRMSFDSSYMEEIDHYFMSQSDGESSELPTQKMPGKMKDLIDALTTSNLPSRFEAGSTILSLDSAGREKFQSGLIYLDEGWLRRRQRTLRMTIAEAAFGVSVTRGDNDNWKEELKISAAQMESTQCVRWSVIQLMNKGPYEISQIKVIVPGAFSDAELAAYNLRGDQAVVRKISQIKPNRNDKCPCGSGKKFKRCHGA